MQAVSASKIFIGQDINTAIKVMSETGEYDKLPLAISPREKTQRLTGWPVINGHLVAVYSTVNNRILSLWLYFEDKDPKTRTEHTKDLIFKVSSYVPETGEIQMTVPHKTLQNNPQQSRRQPIKAGLDRNEASKIMAQSGIPEGLGLAIVAGNKSEQLTGWPVISGYLVVSFSTVNNRIVSLGLHLNDNDPRYRSEQERELEFIVNSYTPATGEMQLIVPNRTMQMNHKKQGR
ncbi:hypothetical protein [uncultured Gimesia sp.]|uniref:hypothetical protein n=1 Tax=uncultured Gimesia sp. TaxID=1678688 RepID=UPI0030DABAAB